MLFEEQQHAVAVGDDAQAVATLTRRLCAAGVTTAVADDLVARFPIEQVADALEVLPARRCSNAAGWLVRAISDGWHLHDEAQRLRAARTRAEHRDAAARALQAHQEQRDLWLAGWAAAVGEALTDTQLTAAVQRITRPVEGLDRRSPPVAASQILAWAIASATAAPDTPLEAALTHALNKHSGDPDGPPTELPDAIPPAPATNAETDPKAFRRRVRHAINDLEAKRAPLESRRSPALTSKRLANWPLGRHAPEVAGGCREVRRRVATASVAGGSARPTIVPRC